MFRRFFPTIIFAGAGLAVAAALVPGEQAAVSEHLASFPDADVWSHQLRPAILSFLCMLPATGAFFYALGGTLARYITREFVTMLLITFFGLAAVWMLFDIEDNMAELRASENAAATAGKLYGAVIPELTVTLLPNALLLALLFTLGRFSKSREVIAMIQSGRGLTRILFPFAVTGTLAVAMCAGLNYHWAPQASATEKKILAAALGQGEAAARFVQFRNPRVRRLWMVGTFPPDYQKGAPLERIRVIQESKDSKLKSVMVASQATWSPKNGAWSFSNATIRDIQPKMPPIYRMDLPNPYVVKTWRETPAEIIQPGLPADQLGIPALTGWLESNSSKPAAARAPYLTQWHHRFAQPFNCLIVVLLATPLGVVFSRRGASSGVALAVFLAAGLLFLTTISLSLGDAGHLSPIAAAWLPNILFLILALYLLRRRLSGRPIYQSIRRLLPTED